MADLKKGLLLLNLGSPPQPTTAPLRRYLSAFLTDRYVIDSPWLTRQILARVVIAPFRAPKSAKAYQKIWTENGSPLIHFSRQFAMKVASELERDWSVRLAMRYGEPNVHDQIRDWDIDELYVLPLYPQYAESSTRSALEFAIRQARAAGFNGAIRFLLDFFAEPEFIQSETQQVQAAITAFHPDHLLFSFHGLPEHHLTKLHPNHCRADLQCCQTFGEHNRFCYRAQAYRTSAAIRGRLDFPAAQTSVSFQSRLGRRPWIKPYTDHLVSKLIARGVRRLLVSSPSFVADCLETLEEVQIRLREQFIREGGEDLMLVSALNDEAHWVKGFSQMVRRIDLPWKSDVPDLR